MIIRTAYQQTEEHAREMAACADIVKEEECWHRESLEAHKALSDFYQGYFSGAIGKEFARATKSINEGPRLRILDVGAGRGETSLYLIDQGHSVFPVEPSYEFCEIIDFMARRFSHELTIYASSAEHLDIDDQFDLVIFNVSLHHCDDPQRALENGHKLLRPGGKLLLVSEPMLPFFKSHDSVEEDMASGEFGHYGGNEHSYHFHEYVSMMKRAGFRNISWEPVQRYLSKDALLNSMAADNRSPGFRKQLKSAYLNLVYTLNRAKLRPIVTLMERLSLVQLTFLAIK